MTELSITSRHRRQSKPWHRVVITWWMLTYSGGCSDRLQSDENGKDEANRTGDLCIIQHWASVSAVRHFLQHQKLTSSAKMGVRKRTLWKFPTFCGIDSPFSKPMYILLIVVVLLSSSSRDMFCMNRTNIIT